MKVLVLGAGGMAGHVVSLYLREQGFTVTTLSATRRLDEQTLLLDVTDPIAFKRFLDATPYDAIINCIGILVKQSEERKDLAAFINAYLPRFLEQRYTNTPTKVVHLSTDGVFGSNNPPYKEDSPYDAQDFYGRSKALGELINAKDLTLRMSIIGPDLTKEGTGLFNWFTQQTGEISGYDKVFWSGVTTIELAKGIEAALMQNLTGLYHFVPKTNISKFNLLQLFKETFDRKDLVINPNSDVTTNKTLVNTRRDFDFEIPDYKTMVSEMKDWIEAHKTLYPHYAVKA